MATPIKADIIYYKADSDFELEFNLNGCCPMRLLSAKPQNSGELLSALGTAVSRSQIIFTVGSLKGELSVIYNICNAIGYAMHERDLSSLGVKERVLLPAGAIPLVSAGGDFGGCVIECGPQAIVILTDDRALRKNIMRSLVHQYVRDFGNNANNMVALIRKQNEKGTIEKEPEKPQDKEPVILEEPKEKIPYDTPTPPVEKHDFSKLEEEFLAEEAPKKRGKKALTAILIVLFLFVGMAAYIFLAEPMLVDEIYSKYTNMYGESGSFPKEDIKKSFGALYSFNPDTVGYIKVGGTNIEYPVAHKEDDPQFYEDHLYNGYYSYLYGGIYTKEPINDNVYYQNVILYGKDTKNGRMFSDLRKLTTLSGYRESPTVRFDTLYSADEYKIFAVFSTDKGEIDKKFLQTEFFDDAEFREYLDMLVSKSAILTSVDIDEKDEIITLVATGYDKNTLVFARKVRPNESALVDTQNATENDGFVRDEEKDESVNTFDPFSLALLDEVIYSKYSKTFEQYLKPKDLTPSTEEDTESKVTSSKKPNNKKEDEEKKELLLTVTNADTGEKESGSVQDILSRIVEAEMGEKYHPEALRAQAIASYGWLLSHGADSDGAPVAALKTASTKVTVAVKSVLELKPYYGEELANTYYFRCSAGATISSHNYWAVDVPYLSSVNTSFDKNYEGYLTRRIYKAADIRDWVYKSAGIDLNRISDKEKWFTVKYDENGVYAVAVRLGGDTKEYPARFLRDTIFTIDNCGEDNTLLSTAYRIIYDTKSDTFTFETRGHGHGVGMSQYGAEVLAQSGKPYEEILKYYYKDITIR